MGSLLALLSFCSSVLLPFCSSVFLSFCLKNNNLFMSYQFKSLSPVPSVGEGEERYYVLSISCPLSHGEGWGEAVWGEAC